jgi:hypothetical protein
VSAAKQQSGIDPKAAAPAGKSAEQKQAEQKAAADNADTPKGDVRRVLHAGPSLARCVVACNSVKPIKASVDDGKFGYLVAF